MAKTKSCYICEDCGYKSVKWMGKCPNCGEWNTLIEQIEQAPAANVRANIVSSVRVDTSVQVKLLKDVEGMDHARTVLDIEELNRVLGGGIVKGSVTLAGGEPGIGKSTLFLQAADCLSKVGTVLYVSGEESAQQIKMRADRLNISSDILLVSEIQLDVILALIENVKPDFLVIDSIQTVYHPDFVSAPGSVSQVRECASMLARIAKQSGMSVFIIGHVTKDGNIAGPRILEHLVDTVLYFEGERHNSFRILRAVKNRFGSTNEIGVFEMSGTGMKQVENPSALLINNREIMAAGACIYCAIEGTRPVLMEVEALLAHTTYSAPRRIATGIDYNRVSIIVAVLEKKLGFKLYEQDIYVNVSGGMRLTEPALDLAVATGIVSSLRNRSVKKNTAFIGEISLTGEIRHVNQMDKRIAECSRMGIDNIVLPSTNLKGLAGGDVNLIGVKTLSDALTHMF